MNRQQFQEAARDFITWAGKFRCDADGHLVLVTEGALAKLPIDLNIPKSSKVPFGVCQKTPFFALTRLYSWRASEMVEGSFSETRAKLETLSCAIAQVKNDTDALEACMAILRWGGDRNSKVGALPFLQSQANVLGYLNAVKAELNLATAVIPPKGQLTSVMAMNSMLTKVHALKSGDGLPIYDSRVAGAIATLVETWRRADGFTRMPLPFALSFPEVGGGGPRRSVRARYPDCIKPPTLYYATGPDSAERAVQIAREWASAKVRLGWLLSELLTDASPSGIRSLEACLFMGGYDCSAINR